MGMAQTHTHWFYPPVLLDVIKCRVYMHLRATDFWGLTSGRRTPTDIFSGLSPTGGGGGGGGSCLTAKFQVFHLRGCLSLLKLLNTRVLISCYATVRLNGKLSHLPVSLSTPNTMLIVNHANRGSPLDFIQSTSPQPIHKGW